MVSGAGSGLAALDLSRLLRSPVVILGLLLAAFVLLQSFLPLGKAIKLGADEDYEYAKATLWLRGFHFYTDIWNDQPLLHTFWITQALKHVSPSVLGPRLVTSAFALLLLISVFLMSWRVCGLAVAALATAMVIASPGFLELASSCMMEIPSLAPALGALAVLVCMRRGRSGVAEAIAGLLFAAALQSKFIGVIYLPLIVLALWLRRTQAAAPVGQINGAPRTGGVGGRRTDGAMAAKAPRLGEWRLLPAGFGKGVITFAVSLAAGFVAIHFLIGERGFWLQLQQSWASHFAGVKSLEYGSPADRPFDWGILIRNWDVTLLAIVGAVGMLRQSRSAPWYLLPLAWTVLMLVVFGSHTPWWSYYYVHNAIPLCWCAAGGVMIACQYFVRRRHPALKVLFAVYLASVAVWMGARVYFQVGSMRESPRLHSALVLKEIERYRPFAQFLYAEDPIYSFHADLPMPPRLAVAALKRFWSGDLTNARLVEELQRVRPGVLLLRNDGHERPFDRWVRTEYRLVYEDAKHRLYALKSVIDQAEP